MRLPGLIVVVSILIIQNILADTTSASINGLWVVRHQLKTAAAIDTMLEIADRLQFTDLFVQVRGRGDAYYQSQYEPLAEGLEADFDPLTYLLEKSKQYDFRIHAWINVFYLWSKERLPESEQHILHRKPEWLVRPIDYDSSAADSNLNHLRNGEGLYHSPLIDEVRQHILDVVNDLLSRYQLAGLHLDYIRYPDERFDFNPVARKNFQREYLLDPLEFKKYPDQFIQSHGNVGYELFFSHWAEFLRNELSEFVEALSANVRAKFPGVTISAAVKPDLERAHWRYYQAWDTWLRQGWLDWALPMNYADDNDRFLRRIRQMIKAVDMNKILMGIALYNQSADSSIDKILTVKELPLLGFVLFSYNTILQDEQLRKLYINKVLKRGPKR